MEAWVRASLAWVQLIAKKAPSATIVSKQVIGPGNAPSRGRITMAVAQVEAEVAAVMEAAIAAVVAVAMAVAMVVAMVEATGAAKVTVTIENRV